MNKSMYHGKALFEILKVKDTINITLGKNINPSEPPYIINDEIGLVIKYLKNTDVSSPTKFTLNPAEIKNLNSLHDLVNHKTYLALVISEDNVCFVTYDKLVQLLPDGLSSKSITIVKKQNSGYQISNVLGDNIYVPLTFK